MTAIVQFFVLQTQIMYFAGLEVCGIIYKKQRREQNMNGIFGDIFDFDGDGKLEIIEQAAELEFIADIIEDEETDDEDDEDDDY